MFLRYLSFLDLRSYRLSLLPRDLMASAAVTFLDIPLGMAYAMVAGLPPAMGLYAASVPALVGALFRSSRHVVTGPTNALSLLVGSAVAAEMARSGAFPMEIGVTLAFGVGVLQFLAGLLRLDVFADYISHPVLRGYITGAALLIILGQLPNLTGTPPSPGNPLQRTLAWAEGLPHAHLLSLAFALGTMALVVGLRRLDRRIPASLLAMVLSIFVASSLHLHDYGLRVASDLAPIPAGLPPLTFPRLELWPSLVSAAVACTVLSLVEASSVARALAARSGQRLDMAAEFSGQGLANLAAAFFGGYPVGGSPSRSALHQQAGAQSRLAAMFCGMNMLLVLLFLGPWVGQTPIPSLAGLLVVVASDLLDRERIRLVLRGTPSDRAAFLATLLGMGLLPLDRAIYLGVGLSLLLFLRRARLLTLREMTIGEKGRFRELDPESPEDGRICPAIRIMNLAGPFFFASAGELPSALDPIVERSELRVLILRLRQAHYLDITAAGALETLGESLRERGKTLLLIGLRPPDLRLLERTGIAPRLGREHLFPAQSGWFTAMEAALRRALELAGEHACGQRCPLAQYLASQELLRSLAQGSQAGSG